MTEFSDRKVIDSWFTNASPWTDAVREKRIESRNLVTDGAIVDAVLDRQPRTVLDLGCGEGWLVRALADRGIEAMGVDAVPALIERAIEKGGGRFRVASYESIAAGDIDIMVDVAIANFALIGKEAVDDLVAYAPVLLNPGGALIIQTLHPVAALGDNPYREGWREGSWTGFGPEFTDPAPWYFRTIEAWVRLITGAGMTLANLAEPVNPKTGHPASVIFTGEKRRP